MLDGKESQESSDEIPEVPERQVGSFDGALQEALGNYAARDAIRKVHLRSDDIELLTAIISTLTPEDYDTRNSSIESIVFDGGSTVFLQHPNCVDTSDFFSQHRFPKLRNLSLSGPFTISSWAWACLKSHTVALVNLSLSLDSPISTSQILSFLASNPNIQSLKLVLPKIDNDRGSDSKSRVPLRHLEKLSLGGEPRRIFPILHRLDLPERVDRTRMGFYDRTPDEVREVVPLVRDYLLRDPRFRDRLGIFVSAHCNGFSLRASVIDVGYHGPDRLPQHGPPYARLSMRTRIFSSQRETEKLCIDILAALPQESIVYFVANLSMTVTKKIAAMPNLEVLYLVKAEVFDEFLLPNPDGPNAHTKLLPSLRRLYLQDARFRDWSPLVRYVTHHTSDDHPFSLNIYTYGRAVEIFPELEQIEDLVEEFVCGQSPDVEHRFKGWDGM